MFKVVNNLTKLRTRNNLKLYTYKLILFVSLLSVYLFIYSGRRVDVRDDVRTNHGGERKLLSTRDINCTPPAIRDFPPDLFTPEQRKNGALVLHIFLAVYVFILLAIVCDDYFVPSIKTLCHRLGMSEDVAGATFMAAATSSPELFINIVGTFVTEGDIGVGAIVGSAVFNILAVPACCGLFGGKVIPIDWWPLTRDCTAYGLTVCLLIYTLKDGRVAWWDALTLVGLYVVYIVTMYFNDSISRMVQRSCRKKKPYTMIQTEVRPLLSDSKKVYNNNDCEDPPEREDTESDKESLGTIPEGFWSKCFFFFSWPISLLLYLTIPDCRQENRHKLWPLTFVMCIAWIASTSYLVSWMITIIGDAFAVPDSVMGLTFLAAGMSVPEAASSVIVTNQGHGAMGISSSIGSNTFDILLCLGLPWLIKSTFFPAVPRQHYVQINSEGLAYNSVSLLTTLFLLYISLAINKFTLDRKIGFLCLVLYITFLIIASLIELNVFFPVNLPTCLS